MDRLRGTVRPLSFQTITAKPYSCLRLAADGNPPSVAMLELLDPMTPVWAEQRAEHGYEGR